MVINPIFASFNGAPYQRKLLNDNSKCDSYDF